MAANVLLPGPEGVFMEKRAFLVFALASCCASVAWAADNAMVGDWKLNVQKSRLVDEMKVTSLGGNQYGFDFGSGTPEKIVADGTDQPGIMGSTFAVTAVGPQEWTVVRKMNGRVMIRATWTLGSDGNTLRDDFTQFDDNGKTTHLIYLYQRKGGGSGFAGDWVSTSEQMDTAYTMQVRPFEGDGISIVVGSAGVTKNVKFDGKDYPNPGSPRPVVSSAQRVDGNTIALTDKLDGKVLSTRELRVSDDGKTLTMTVHQPGRSEPNILVFERE